MSKGLASYPEHERLAVARRRTASNTKGNGYWGAMDFLNSKASKPKPVAKKPRTKKARVVVGAEASS